MDIKSHILSSFNEDLATIRNHLIEMVELVESSLNRAEEGLAEGNTTLCANVVADDDAIDGTERVIDRIAMDVLLRYNPVASDLRFVVSSISIAKNLERIGDHASQIAKNTRKIYKKEIMGSDLAHIKDLFSLTTQQFQHAKHAIIKTDPKSAEKCLDGEEHMRKITKKVSKIFVQMMGEGAENASTYMSLVMVARSIERISKISCNIAEDIIYIETAENVRDQEV